MIFIHCNKSLFSARWKWYLRLENETHLAGLHIGLYEDKDWDVEDIEGDTDDATPPPLIPEPITPTPLPSNPTAEFKSVPDAGDPLSNGESLDGVDCGEIFRPAAADIAAAAA